MECISTAPVTLPSETAGQQRSELSLKRRLSTADTVSDIHRHKKPHDTDMPGSESEEGSVDDRPTLHRDMQSIASHLKCPMTQALMVEPVVAMGDGCLYERSAITEWMKRSRTSPVTRAMMTKSLSAECVGVRAAISDLVSSGTLDAEICIEWHVARGKLARDDECAKRHFESAVKLGCTQTPKVLEMLAHGIELRKHQIEFRRQAMEADLEMDWIERLLSATTDVPPVNAPIERNTDGIRGVHYIHDEDGDYSHEQFIRARLRAAYGGNEHRPPMADGVRRHLGARHRGRIH